jgi:beta-glucosidase
MKRIQLIRGLAALAFATLLTAVAAAKDVKVNPAVTPEPPRLTWKSRFEGMNSRVKQGNADLIFIGDSITHFWQDAGMGVWYKYYGKRNAVNLGISGDQTQHVLWRLDHGNIDGISPKLAVVMIGTNNAGNAHTTSEETAEGVKAVVEKLRAKLPQTKILLLAIFPRGATAEDPIRQVNQKTNQMISKLADDKMVFYLDINAKLLRPDGRLGREVMADFLHPGVKGYEVWAEAIEPTVARLMGETPNGG